MNSFTINGDDIPIKNINGENYFFGSSLYCNNGDYFFKNTIECEPCTDVISDLNERINKLESDNKKLLDYNKKLIKMAASFNTELYTLLGKLQMKKII